MNSPYDRSRAGRRTRGICELDTSPRRCIIVQTAPRPATRPITRLTPYPLDLKRGGLDRAEDDQWRPGRLSGSAPTVARRAMIDVDVVIVSRAGDSLLSCLDSLTAGADGAVLSVTVVDNGCSEGTLEAVAAREDGIRVIAMGEDTGTATGANAGMARGAGRYILVLDPNTVVNPGSLRTLVEFADRHPSAGAVAPRLRTLDGRPHPSTEKGDRRGYEVSWVPGTAVLVPRVVHAATAGFDEDYFSLWADVDWCRRIRAAGYTVWCLPTATVLHDDRPVDDRAAELATARDYHDGAYRYWLKHDAPAPWHPSFWTKAAALRTQALSATLRSRFAPRSDAIQHSRLYQPRRAQPQL